MTETRTKQIPIQLADDPDDDIRIARMEMELFTWRKQLIDEGYGVVNVEMEAIDSEVALIDGEIKPLVVVFQVTMHIVRKTHIPHQRKEK